jgi:hypothetical protein
MVLRELRQPSVCTEMVLPELRQPSVCTDTYMPRIRTYNTIFAQMQDKIFSP